jgi:AcrR family transcriptional regulator
MATTADDRRMRSTSRWALLEAAVDEFSEKGYDEATLADIAERAGVTTGAVYNHFDGKLDLLVAAIGEPRVTQFWQEVTAAARLPWEQTVEVLARGLAQRPDPNALLLLDAIVLARRDAAVAARFREGIAVYGDAMRKAAEQGTAAGVIEPAMAADDLVRLLQAIGFGLLVLEALGAPPPSADGFRQLVEALLQSHEGGADDDDPALARVRMRSGLLERARERQHEAIAAAAEEGFSLRRIGDAAGLSHEGVRRIVAERSRRR